MAMHKAEVDNGETDGLEMFFHAARAARPEPSEALMARIAADAALAQPRPVPATLLRKNTGALARLGAALGGWRSVTGLATATLAGVWIGFYTPAPLAGLADSYLGTSLSDDSATVAEDVEFLPDFDDYLAEG